MDLNNIEYVLIGQNILSDFDICVLNKFKPIYESSFYGDEMEPFNNFIERLNNNAISNVFKTYVVIAKILVDLLLTIILIVKHWKLYILQHYNQLETMGLEKNYWRMD